VKFARAHIFAAASTPPATVCLSSPASAALVSIVMNVVEVLEVNPLPGSKPLHWVLLTIACGR